MATMAGCLRKQIVQRGNCTCIRKDTKPTAIVNTVHELGGWTLFFSHIISHPYMSDIEWGTFEELFPEVFAELGVTTDSIATLYQRVTEHLESQIPEIVKWQDEVATEWKERRERDKEEWLMLGKTEEGFEEEYREYDLCFGPKHEPVEDSEGSRWLPAHVTGLVAFKGNRVIVANPRLFPTYIFNRKGFEVVEGGELGQVRVVEMHADDGATLVVLSPAFEDVPECRVVAARKRCASYENVVDKLCRLLPEATPRGAAVVIQLRKRAERKIPAIPRTSVPKKRWTG